MERRIARINIGFVGGTASSSSKTCKAALPTSCAEEMEISRDHRDLVLAFGGSMITLSRRLNGLEFALRRLAQGHEVRILRLYDGDVLRAAICADFTGQAVSVGNQPVPLIKTAFGNNPLPAWEDFQQFLEERCIPRQRAGMREYWDALAWTTTTP